MVYPLTDLKDDNEPKCISCFYEVISPNVEPCYSCMRGRRDQWAPKQIGMPKETIVEEFGGKHYPSPVEDTQEMTIIQPHIQPELITDSEVIRSEKIDPLMVEEEAKALKPITESLKRMETDIGGIKDSGCRTEFGTGAVRDGRTGKGRFDLIQLLSVWRIAKWMEKGCLKYGDRNWEKGIPVSKYLDSGIRHLVKFIFGLRDEPHLTAAVWNFMCAMETIDRINLGLLPEELYDIPDTYKDIAMEEIEALLEEIL